MDFKIFTYLIVFAGVVNLLRMTLFLVGSDIYNVLAIKRRKNMTQLTSLPVFSVIIPARNEEKTVIRAVESVLKSNYPKDRMQIIVVDDGSTDNTAKNVTNYISKHKNAPVTLVQQTNAGKAHALNNGIKNYAIGDLVMCLDADSFIKADSLHNAAKHFSDPKVKAMSANVKIIERPGLLNIIQRYEYLVCYQMKRAESLLNCEYIVGGIGSVFRRSVLEKINYYDTNTVTEDIDITMKVIQLGNKENKVIYGSDVVTYTESVMNIPDLIKQRFRWKWGRSQTFLKNKTMFLSRDDKFTKSLSMFYLPLAIFGDIMYFLEPVLLTYILAVSFIYKDPIALINAWLVISSYMIFNILAEDTYTQKEKAKFVVGAPFMYVLFYILSFVEYIALMKSVIKLPSLRASLSDTKIDWIRVKRPTENSYAPSFGKRAFSAAFSIVLIFAALAGAIGYTQFTKKPLREDTLAQVRTEPKNVGTKVQPVVYKHIVQYGESRWKISEEYYGTGIHWNDIKVNDDDQILNPGDIVEIPVSPTSK